MGPGDVVPVQETEIQPQGQIFLHLPTTYQVVLLLTTTVACLQATAAPMLELTHLLAKHAVVKTGPAGIEAT